MMTGAEVCINCAQAFKERDERCYFGFPSQQVGPLCMGCNGIVKAHALTAALRTADTHDTLRLRLRAETAEQALTGLKRQLMALGHGARTDEGRLRTALETKIAKWREDSESIFCTLLEGQVIRRRADDLAALFAVPETTEKG